MQIIGKEYFSSLYSLIWVGLLEENRINGETSGVEVYNSIRLQDPQSYSCILKTLLCQVGYSDGLMIHKG